MRGRCQGAPARVVDRTDPRRGLFGPPHVCGHLLSPSCQDSSRRPWSGRSTSPAVRSVPRSARGRCGGVAKGRPRVWWTAQACGAAPPARWSRYITERREGVSASSIVSTYQHWLVQLVVMCASFPRSVPRAAAPGGPPEGPRRAPGGSPEGPRRAPGGPPEGPRREHPPPCDFSLSALIPKGLLHQARLSILIQQ